MSADETREAAAQIRRRVLAAATAPKRGDNPDFEALATSSLVMAFNDLAPDDMVLAPVVFPPGQTPSSGESMTAAETHYERNQKA